MITSVLRAEACDRDIAKIPSTDRILNIHAAPLSHVSPLQSERFQEIFQGNIESFLDRSEKCVCASLSFCLFSWQNIKVHKMLLNYQLIIWE